MNALTFDTLQSAERLIASGMPEKQAKAVTETMKQAQDAHLEELVSKGDLNNGLDLLRKEILLSEQRLFLRLGALIVAMTGLILAVMQLSGA